MVILLLLLDRAGAGARLAGQQIISTSEIPAQVNTELGSPSVDVGCLV